MTAIVASFETFAQNVVARLNRPIQLGGVQADLLARAKISGIAVLDVAYPSRQKNIVMIIRLNAVVSTVGLDIFR